MIYILLIQNILLSFRIEILISIVFNFKDKSEFIILQVSTIPIMSDPNWFPNGNYFLPIHCTCYLCKQSVSLLKFIFKMCTCHYYRNFGIPMLEMKFKPLNTKSKRKDF